MKKRSLHHVLMVFILVLMTVGCVTAATLKPAPLIGGATKGWVDLGGNFRGIPQSIAYGGDLFAFVRSRDQHLEMCQVSSKEWLNFGGQLTGNPAIAQSPNNSLAVVGLMQNGSIQVNYIQPHHGTFTGWADLVPGNSSRSWSRKPAPVIAVNVEQRIEAFAIDVDGRMWHTFQTDVRTPIKWSPWQPLSDPGMFDTEADQMTVFLNGNLGALQAVAVGRDYKMYQAAQYQGGGYDSWSRFKVVGTDGAGDVLFTLGTAASYSTAPQSAVYAGYNTKVHQNTNPLVYTSPGSPNNNTWTSLPTTSEQFPVTDAVPVLTNMSGELQLAWLSRGTIGQMMFITQRSGTKFQWRTVKNLGKPNPDFTGDMSSVYTGSTIAYFQRAGDHTLRYFNFEIE